MTATPAPRPEWTPGDEIRKARMLAGLKQAALAEAIGVARSTISAWENDESEPGITHWRAIAQACNALWLLGGSAPLGT